MLENAFTYICIVMVFFLSGCKWIGHEVVKFSRNDILITCGLKYPSPKIYPVTAALGRIRNYSLIIRILTSMYQPMIIHTISNNLRNLKIHYIVQSFWSLSVTRHSSWTLNKFLRKKTSNIPSLQYQLLLHRLGVTFLILNSPGGVSVADGCSEEIASWYSQFPNAKRKAQRRSFVFEWLLITILGLICRLPTITNWWDLKTLAWSWKVWRGSLYWLMLTLQHRLEYPKQYFQT